MIYFPAHLQEPEKRQVPFQGVGRTLGSSSTPATSEPSASVPISTASAPTSVLDDSLPSTSLQIRLADGTRMVAHFNFQQTVGDIRAFIDASRPSDTRAFQLQTVGFPPRILSDPTQTIEQAGLANSVVIQKFWWAAKSISFYLLIPYCWQDICYTFTAGYYF